MKKLLILFALALLPLLGSQAWAETALIEITGTKAASFSSASGYSTPENAVVSYSQTFSTAKQSTGGNSATLTIKNMQGYTITGLKFQTRSNSGGGAGSMTVTAGTTEILNFSGTYNSAWSTAYTKNYEWITKNPTTTHAIATGEDVVFALAATANSLYWQAVEITYVPSGDDNQGGGEQGGGNQGGETPATGSAFYTWNFAKGSNSNYANYETQTVEGITWKLQGNAQRNEGFCIGGKSLSNADRDLHTETAMGSAISKIVLHHGARSNVTINSVSLLVADNANFNNATTVALPAGHDFGSAGEFEFTGNWAKDSYYKIVFNVSSPSSTSYLPITKIEFFAPAQGSGEGGDPGTDPTPEASVNVNLAAGNYTAPQTLNVTWANLGGIELTITKGSETVASCSDETLGSFSYTFATSGTYVLSIEALDANADELDTPDRTYTIVAVEIDPVNSYFTSTANPASLNAGTYAILLNKDGSTGTSSNTDATSLNGVSKTSLNGDVKIEFSNGTNNTNYPLVWDNGGTIRIYQNNTLTITPLNGKVIKEVALVTDGASALATENANGALSNDQKTWIGEEATSLVFTVTSATKIKSIKVVTGIAVPAPQFVVNGTALTGDNATLTSGTTVALAADGVETIYYNLNGGNAFIEYTEPIAVTAETHIWAKSILNGEESPVVDMTFYVLTQKTIAQFVNDKPVGDAQVTGPLTVYYKAPYTDPDTNEDITHVYVKDQAGDYMRVHFPAAEAPAVEVGQTLSYVIGSYKEARGQEILATGYGEIAGTAAEVAPEVETVAEFYTNPKNYQYVKVETVNISPAPGENIYALYDEDMAHIKIEDKFDYVTVPYDHAGHSHDVVGILIYETDEKGEAEYRFVPTAFSEAAVAAPVCTTPELALTGYNEEKGGYPKGTHLNFTAAEGETVYYTLNGAMPKADDENTYEFVGTNVFNRVGTFTLIAIANAEGKTPSNATDPISITIYDPNAVEVTETKTHTLNADNCSIGQSYNTYTYTEDGVQYSIYASKSDGIQLNTNKNSRNSGLVVTANNGYTLKSIEVEYYSGSSQKSLDVYTCDDHYTSADNLFGDNIQGDLYNDKLTDTNAKVEFEEGVAYVGLKPTATGSTKITSLTFVWEKTVEGAPSETIAPETRRYKLVKSESELIDGILHGDRFVLATPYDNKYYAMSTDDRGNYRESVVVELESDGETLIVPRNSDVQPISLFVDNDQDAYFFNVGTNRYLKATTASKNQFNTIELDDRTTEEAETASAQLTFYDENRDVPYGVQIEFENAKGATIAFNFNLNGDKTNNVPLLRWACYDNNADKVQLPQLFHMVTENGFDRTAETITETHSTNHIALHTDGETWVANKMELTDGMAYALDVDVETPHVKYLRNIKANLVGTWQPLYVPFDIDDWSDFATEVIQFAGADANGLKFTYVTTGTPLQAHELYIFKPKAETTAIHFRTGTTTVKAAPDEDVASDSYTYNGEVYTMHGTYTGVSGDDMRDTGAYALSGGDFKRASASNPGLKAFRIYLTIEDATTGTSSVKAPQKVAFHVVDPEQTGIESVSVDAQETSEEYFDLTGRRVVEPTTGLYIQSGRKVIIRK